MSALGQKRTSEHVQSMSALPPIADIGTQARNVRFVPKADICTAAISAERQNRPPVSSCTTNGSSPMSIMRTRAVPARLCRTSLRCFGIRSTMGSPTPARTKIDHMFRLISAGFAGPHVSNTMIGTMLRPDHARESGNELSTAVRTLTDQ